MADDQAWRNLAAAVINRALRDLRPRIGARNRDGARRFLWEEGGWFERLADFLELDPDYVRRQGGGGKARHDTARRGVAWLGQGTFQPADSVLE